MSIDGDLMANIIEELYYGNIYPQELNSELTNKLKKKLNKLADKEDVLTERLTGSDKDMFLDYARTYTEFSSISNTDSFITGFRLGAKFIYDTFLGNPND